MTVFPKTLKFLRVRTVRRVALTVLVPIALVAAGCGDDDVYGSGGSGGGSSSGDNGDMTLKITAPTDQAQVDSSFEVKVDSSVDLGPTDSGKHHIHLYYDGDTDDGDYDIVYGDTFTVDRDLGDGDHTIKAVIANADHSLTDAEAEVHVSVGGSGGGGDDGGDTTTTGGY
jgi:hypothetical protein